MRFAAVCTTDERVWDQQVERLRNLHGVVSWCSTREQASELVARCGAHQAKLYLHCPDKRELPLWDGLLKRRDLEVELIN